MFEDAEIGIPCPGCGEKNPNRVEADELIAGLDQVDQTMADLRKAFGGGKKTIKIKL
ncbi:hypothetical protein FHT98_0624 [Bosea sp. AK1]|uniref:hypothetical protein n=1 Tax=Bosea sp. AK1 TaxID=2587160 RepID=UPI00116B5B8C|nr:hypothetical protein [Bosea sp. AK1]TQI72904.1 hypothetical protein FHT98_0624 [Bosea sp. AK1]